MQIEERFKNKKAILFGLDDVLYPKKDYLLQVYYLFSEFMAYTEQIDSAQLIAFMQAEFFENGSTNIFEKTAAKFGIPDKYLGNFKLLHQNARLPLKLLLFQQVLSLLQSLVVDRKQVIILVDGDPAEQLNKIKQMEWHGLEGYLKLYFSAEFKPKPSSASIDFIIESHQLTKGDMLLIGSDLSDETYAEIIGLSYLNIKEIL